MNFNKKSKSSIIIFGVGNRGSDGSRGRMEVNGGGLCAIVDT